MAKMHKTEIALRNKMLNNPARRRKVFPTTNGRRRTREHLAEFLAEMQFNKGAEIGVRVGRFSRESFVIKIRICACIV